MQWKEFQQLPEGTRVWWMKGEERRYGIVVTAWEYERSGKPVRCPLVRPDGEKRALPIHHGLLHVSKHQDQ